MDRTRCLVFRDARSRLAAVDSPSLSGTIHDSGHRLIAATRFRLSPVPDPDYSCDTCSHRISTFILFILSIHFYRTLLSLLFLFPSLNQVINFKLCIQYTRAYEIGQRSTVIAYAGIHGYVCASALMARVRSAILQVFKLLYKLEIHTSFLTITQLYLKLSMFFLVNDSVSSNQN